MKASTCLSTVGYVRVAETWFLPGAQISSCGLSSGQAVGRNASRVCGRAASAWLNRLAQAGRVRGAPVADEEAILPT